MTISYKFLENLTANLTPINNSGIAYNESLKEICTEYLFEDYKEQMFISALQSNMHLIFGCITYSYLLYELIYLLLKKECDWEEYAKSVYFVSMIIFFALFVNITKTSTMHFIILFTMQILIIVIRRGWLGRIKKIIGI